MVGKFIGKLLRRRSVALLLLVIVATSAFLFRAQRSESEAGGGSPYSSLDYRAGVWNDGQAAPWDLPFIDHFKLFGAYERARGWKPEQPIKFSHVRHVQVNKMECQYCHWSVTKSAFAAIPEVETCMGCHKWIQGGSAAQKPDATAEEKAFADVQKAQIKVLAGYWERNEAIDWKKVHVMPDHVRFSHKRHVKAGVGCQECHGQIPKMEVVERVSSMKMGWCLDCHRSRGASIDCTTCHK